MSAEREPHPGGMKADAEREPHSGGMKADAQRERRLAALRGATTLDSDTREQLMERTAELLDALMRRNGLCADDMVSLFFTATGDVRSEFPAAAVRAAGISDVPMMCARELDINGGSAIPLCVRVMAHVYTDRPRPQLRHTYLHGARQLRSDLPE